MTMTQHPAHIQQALAEMANAENTGSTDAQRAAAKRLAAAGYEQPKPTGIEAVDEPDQSEEDEDVEPTAAAAAANEPDAEKTAEEAKPAARTRPPAGRRTPTERQAKA